MIDLSYDLSGIFHGEALSSFDHIRLMELYLEWLISHMMCQGCSMGQHCVHPITPIERKYI